MTLTQTPDRSAYAEHQATRRRIATEADRNVLRLRSVVASSGGTPEVHEFRADLTTWVAQAFQAVNTREITVVKDDGSIITYTRVA